jgi:hypothetical protein
MSELLRKEQGKGEVAKQENGEQEGYGGDDVDVHGRLPQPATSRDIEKRQDEEKSRIGEHQEVLHGFRFSQFQRGALQRSAPSRAA